MKSKRFCLFAALWMILSLFSPVAFSEEWINPSQQAVTEISTAEDWALFARSCALERYSAGRVFSLTADIDLTGCVCEAVPYFSGTFRGNGHTISAVHITAAGSRLGLFRQIGESGIVENLSVQGSILPEGTQEYIGGIAGVNEGEIISCSFSGTVRGISCIGGIVGINSEGAKITDCRFSGYVIGEHQSGGIAGENDSLLTGCENRGDVNTSAITPAKNAASFSFTNFDISSLSQDDFVNLSNIGGITGENKGTTQNCSNHGTVGYAFTAYNVGGIAGKSSGFINACSNGGSISGRRDVGGIAGQLIPYAAWNFTNDELQELSDAISYMHYLLGNIIDLTDGSVTNIRSQLQSMQGYTWQALEALAAGIGFDGSVLDWEVDIGELTDALNNMAAQSSSLVSTAKNSVDAMAANVEDIARQMGYILNLLFSLLNNSQELVTRKDLSFSEAYEHQDGAVAGSVNTGPVRAENNAGGIVGTLGFEIAFDMEDTLNASSLLTTHAEQSLFSAVRACRSDAEIFCRADGSGGIIGRMDMGAVVDCIVSGTIGTQNGDYAGGIAGSSKGTLSGCWSRVTVEGRRYVGGIAGLCEDLLDCSAWTHLKRGTEYLGAVAGWAEGTVSGNRYVEGRPDGVDGVSRTGQCEPVSISAFLSSGTVPDSFSTVTLEFVVEGEVIETQELPFGGTVENFPSVPNRGSSVWQWEDFDSSHIYSNRQITGSYQAPSTTIATGETVPLFLAEGEFTEGQTLKVLPYQVNLDSGAEASGYTLSVNDYEGPLTVRMRGGTGFEVYARSGSSWEKLPSEMDGQYLVFSVTSGDSILCIPTQDCDWRLILIAAAILAEIILLLILYRQENRKP